MSFLSHFVSTKRRISPSVFFAAAVFLAAGLLTPWAFAAKGPAPDQTISLESLGFQTIAPRYLLSGGTMLTVDYVDNDHLLVTFGVPRLMKRLAECASDDQDRVVDAVLLELPSGRELARTEWRLHDISQYLWPLGHGFFLLRQRNHLATFAPLAQLASGDAFVQHPFLHFDDSTEIDAIHIAPDRDLLTIETSKRVVKSERQVLSVSPPPAAVVPTSLGPSQPTGALSLRRRDPAPAAGSNSVSASQPDNPVHISFLRLLAPRTSDGVLIAQHAGSIDSRKHLLIPLTAEGFLRTRDSSNAGVMLDFATFSGQVTDLGSFDTTCPPSPTFLTQSEFVAFGCRGSDDHLTLAGFNIHGDMLWQMYFSDPQAYPSFSAANSAGRFAFSRTLTSGALIDGQAPFEDQLTAQEVRVLQTYNGKQLLRVNTSPIQRSGQNFALSPDGLSLAVIRDPVDSHLKEVQHKPAIEIYKLPPLSDKDRQEVNAEMALAPPHSTAPIVFSSAQVKEAVASSEPGLGAPVANPATNPQTALLPADAKLPPPESPSTNPVDDSRPHFSIRVSDATAPRPPSPEPVAQPTEQAMGEDQGDGPRKPPTLYDPDYDGPQGLNGEPSSSKPPQQ